MAVLPKIPGYRLPKSCVILNMEVTKKCTKCGEEKPLAQFSKQNGTKDGLKYSCKICNSKIAKDRYSVHKEDHIEKVRKWQAEHPEQVREYKRAYKEKL